MPLKLSGLNLPATSVEMQSGSSNSETFTTPGRGPGWVNWTTTTATQDQSRRQFGFPGGFTIDSSYGHTAASMFPTSSSSNDPPTYKEAVFGETDPLLSKPVQSMLPARQQLSNARRDVSSLIVRDPPPKHEEEHPKAKRFVLYWRVFMPVGIIAGIGLVLWGQHYQASVGPDPSTRDRTRIQKLEGFGWTFIAVTLLMYLIEGFGMYKMLELWKSKDLLGHLEKVKRGTPKLTWYMTTFHRDTSTAVITNSDGSMRTDQRNDKITTWSGTQQFHFSKWADVTPDQTNILGAINEITFHAKFILADEKTTRAYDAQKQAFIDENKRAGQEYSIDEIFEIEGMEKKMEVAGPPSLVTNVCTLCLVFWTVGFYYFWLYWLSASRRRVNYTYVKELSV